jgi:hypothetical protein
VSSKDLSVERFEIGRSAVPFQITVFHRLSEPLHRRVVAARWRRMPAITGSAAALPLGPARGI